MTIPIESIKDKLSLIKRLYGTVSVKVLSRLGPVLYKLNDSTPAVLLISHKTVILLFEPSAAIIKGAEFENLFSYAPISGKLLLGIGLLLPVLSLKGAYSIFPFPRPILNVDNL